MGVGQAGFEQLGERVDGKVGLGDPVGCECIDQAIDIGGLVVVRSNAQRAEDRRTADPGHFRHGRRPGPADHQMAGGIERSDIVEEGLARRVDAGGLIGLAGHGEGFLTGLLDDIKARSQHFREFCHRLGHGLRQDARAQRSAEHEQIDPSIRLQRRIAGLARRDDRAAQGIAGQDVALARLFRQAVETFKTGGHETGPGGEYSVDPAQHGVLFVDREGNAQGLRHGEGRKGGVAAKARDHIRLPPLGDRPGLGKALGQFDRSFGQFQRVLRRRAGGVDLIHGHGRKIRRMLQSARIGDQAHLPAARDQGLGGGARRKHVSAGTPGGDQAAARRHATCRRA